jgi:small subunit ribosomal protein S16
VSYSVRFRGFPEVAVLKIRLRRMGSKQDAFYRVIVSDSRLTPRGRFVDVLGTYDPGTHPATVRLDLARADEWIRRGAHPSETVRSLLGQARAAGGAGRS